jgi:hypothetical protein
MDDCIYDHESEYPKFLESRGAPQTSENERLLRARVKILGDAILISHMPAAHLCLAYKNVHRTSFLLSLKKPNIFNDNVRC